MRDPQEYDVTDLLNELVDDTLNFRNYIYMWEHNEFDWPRLARRHKGRGLWFDGWAHSVTQQYVEYCCGRHTYMVDMVFEQMEQALEAGESPALHMMYQADNYDHINSFEDLDNLMEVMAIWIEEGVVKI